MLKITNIDLVDFSVPLGDSPLIVSTGGLTRKFSSRRGSYLRIDAVTDNGRTIHGTGELLEPVFTWPADEDPFEVLEQSRIFIRNISESILNSTINAATWQRDIDLIASNLSEKPSSTVSMVTDISVFAFEQALLLIACRLTGGSLTCCIREYISGQPIVRSQDPKIVRFNTMKNARLDERVNSVPGCVKVKIGSESPENDAELINSLCSGRSLRLRLDANRMWTLEQAQRFMRTLTLNSQRSIVYIEEPVAVRSIAEVETYLGRLPICVGLDESLLLPGAQTFLKQQSKVSIIFKASLHSLISWKELISTEKSRFTITCTFETGLGLGFLCCLSAAVNPENFHGISALPSMISADASTSRFNDLLTVDDEGPFANLSRVEDLVLSF
jgi:hypothetical protein